MFLLYNLKIKTILMEEPAQHSQNCKIMALGSGSLTNFFLLNATFFINQLLQPVLTTFISMNTALLNSKAK